MIEDRVLQARPLSDLVSLDVLPSHLFSLMAGDGNGEGEESDSPLDRIFYTAAHAAYSESGFSATVDLLVTGNFELGFPGLDYITLGIGTEQFFPFTVRIGVTRDDLAIAIENIELNVRFSRDLLLPAELDESILPGDAKYPRYKPTSSETERARLSTTGSVHVNREFDLAIRSFDEPAFGPVKLPNLQSVYLVMEGVKVDFSRGTTLREVEDAGFGREFQGLYARNVTIAFQDDLEFLPLISANSLVIGTGGISGSIAATFELGFNPATGRFTGDAHGSLFGNDDLQIGLRKFELELRTNEVVRSEITGQLILPFFEKPVEIEVSLDLKGNFSIGLKGAAGGVLCELTKDDLISMKVTSFGFSKRGRELAFALGGSIKPLIGDGMKWPEFGVNSLIVKRSPNGKWGVIVEGGWIEFREPLRVGIGAFSGELRKVGFGMVDEATGRRFVSFSGSVGFVSEFALVAEFDDLRLIYPSPIDVTLERARIGFAIPDAVIFVGEVSKRGDGFEGSLDLTIVPIELRVQGGAEFGSTPTYTYLQILLGLELPPPGIILGSTPLAIRGGEAKFALNMRPSMDPGWEWAVTPPKGIMPLSKMVAGQHAKFFAAGLKITTTDGTLLDANVLLALILDHGYVVMIEGRGAVLTKVFGKGSPGNPPFYTLMIIDGREKYVSVNLAIKADLAKGVVKVAGTLGAFFDFEDTDNWYIRLGQKTPRNKRIEAVAYKVLKGTSYFDVSSGPHLLFGGDFGINEKVNFKVGHAKVEIRIGGEADLSWKPAHAAGMLEFFANIEIRVCGFGASLNASGDLDAKSPYPRHLHVAAGYRYSFNLPWPLPDVKGHGEIEKTWKDGSRISTFPLLVSEVRVDGEMPGIPAVPLQRYGTLAEHPPSISEIPLVSLDARPTIRFEYPVNDATSLLLAGNASNGPVLHKIGDDEFSFAVRSIRLQSCAIPVDHGQFAGFGTDVGWTDVTIPYGVWLADNSISGYPAATILRLFSNTPFTHFRQSGFQGALYNALGLDFASTDAAWLGSIAETDLQFGENEFVSAMDAPPAASAADLAARTEDQTRQYPAGMPQQQWKYLGFSALPMQFGMVHVKVTSMVGVRAVADADGVLRPFDLIDLHFLPPDEVMPEIRSLPTLVRGIYFEGTIQVEFAAPVSDCVLYFYPVKSKRAEGPLPDDLRHGEARTRPIDEASAQELISILEDLSQELREAEADIAIEVMVSQIRKCAAEVRETTSGDRCCAELKKSWEQLRKATSSVSARLKLLEVRLARLCEGVWKVEPAPEDGVFLRFELAPTVGSKRKVSVVAQRSDGDDGAKAIDTVVRRDAPENLRRVRVTKDANAFDSLIVAEPGSESGRGWFLVAIGYRIDVEERHDAIVEKIKDMVATAWAGGEGTGDGEGPGTESPAVVLSPRNCYRLVIETTVDTAAPERHYFYFRTDGPPASYLKEYVAWTVAGAGGYPLFRDYDVSIRFCTNYADQLFADLPLELRLRSASGTHSAHALDSHVEWESEGAHLLRPEEQAFIDVLNASGQITIDPEDIPGDKTLALRGGAEHGGTLESDQEYTATLALAPEAGFVQMNIPVKSAFSHMTQPMPFLVTPDANDSVALGRYPALGLAEGTLPVAVRQPDPKLFEFSFRTSRYCTFTDAFSQWAEGDTRAPRLQVTAGANAALTSVADVSETVWRPAQALLREKQLLVQRRLATQDELLAMLDRKAEINAQLDEAFNRVLSHLKGAPSPMDPLPSQVELYCSPECLLIRMPEPIEFARVSASYGGFAVRFACSPDERSWLIFPLAASAFQESGKLSLTYRLDAGPDRPRYRNGTPGDETVEITLFV